jgi:hypothetical protein
VALASTKRVDELIEQIIEQFGVTTIPMDLPPAAPRVARDTAVQRYRRPLMDLTTPSPKIIRTIPSRAVSDFQLCPLLLTTGREGIRPADRLRELLFLKATQQLPVTSADLNWLPTREAKRLFGPIDDFQQTLASYLRSTPRVISGETAFPYWRIDWGPFLYDGTSIIDLTMSEGDPVGLSLANAEHPGQRGGIYNLSSGKIHWLSSAELASIHQELPSLARELAEPSPGPREGRSAICRRCRRRHFCHWVESENHRL